ncbi:Tad domain-containing protein [Castellaniella sp.]|uniref:TadE/TadG family type IV pilus assembly protein n=1 Tax=Castellaniella sp. TaxID=1955812 RepID=UPI002AFEC07E|nr:Tad domain-containing protein [Castellaniella sp.]
MKYNRFLKRVRSDKGNMAVLAGAMLFALVGFGGVAIDYGRASGLHRKIQSAADVAVREAVRGKTDAQVQELVHGQLDAYLREMGYSDPKTRTSVAITRSGDTVKLAVTTKYDSLFGRYYGQSQQLLNVTTDANARAFCVADGAQRRWTAQSEACPTGLIGSITHEREEGRTSSCASETAGAPVWSGWTPTGSTRNRVESCAAPCVAPAAQTQWVSATAACPTGYLGSRTIETQQRRTASCPAPTGNPVWSVWANTTTTRVASDTCALKCTPAARQTQWVNRSGNCPSGQTGTITWQAEQARTSTCPATTGNPIFGGWLDTGTKRSETNTCQAAPGHVIWTTPGTYTWTVPAGVTRISALAIGGGGSGLQVRPYDEYHNYYSGVTSSVSGSGVNLTANGGTGSAGGCGGSKQGGGCGGDGGTGVMAQCPSWTK